MSCRREPGPARSRPTALADAEGIAAVSMRAIATALGTSAGSLYRYLSSRNDLLDLMTDRVVGEPRPHPRRTATGCRRCCCWPASNWRCTDAIHGCST